MPLSRSAHNIAETLVIVVILAGIGGTHVLGVRNGFYELLTATISPVPGLPQDWGVPLKTEYTGFWPLDKIFTFMVPFFVPTVDGSDHALSLQAFHFAGQLGSLWTVMMAEELRNGASLLRIAIWGLVIEFAGAGVFIPFWCHTQLHRMSATRSPVPRDALFLPFAVSIGYVLPHVAIIAASPLPATPYSRHFWVGLRLFHPVFITALLAAHRLVRARISASPEAPSLASRLAVYDFAAFLAIIPHQYTAVLGDAFSRGLLSPSYASMFSNTAHSMPSFWTREVPKVKVVADGTRAFLGWDEAMTCAGMVVWAVAIVIGLGVPRGQKMRRVGLWGWAKMLGWFLLGGHAGLVVGLLKEREMMDLQARIDKEEKDMDASSSKL